MMAPSRLGYEVLPLTSKAARKTLHSDVSIEDAPVCLHESVLCPLARRARASVLPRCWHVRATGVQDQLLSGSTELATPQDSGDGPACLPVSSPPCPPRRARLRYSSVSLSPSPVFVPRRLFILVTHLSGEPASFLVFLSFFFWKGLP